MKASALRRIAVLVWLAAVAACIYGVAHMRMTADMSAFLPRGVTPDQRLLVEQLRDGVASKLLLIGITGADPPTLARLSRGVAQRLRTDSNYLYAANGDTALAPAERAFVYDNRYVLSPAVTPQHFTVAALRDALRDDLDALASDAGAFVKPLLPADPTGETLRLAEAYAGNAQPRREQGVWFARDGREALLIAQTKAAGFDTDAQARASATLRAAFAQAQAESNAPAASLEFSGPAVFALEARNAIEGDATRLSAAALALVALLLWWAYRAPRLLALALVPVASGALAGLAAVSASFGFVHGITLGFGTTMIGEAVDYAIYFFAQRRDGAPPEAGIMRIWPTLRLGTLTSVFGFSAMLLSGFPGLAQLGVYSVAGLIAALAVTRWVMPALAVGTPAPRDRAAMLAGLLQRLPRGRTAIAIVALSVVLAVVWLAAQHAQIWESDLANLSPARAVDKARDERLRAELGAPDVRLLLVARGPNEEAALQAAEGVGARLDAWIGEGELRSFDTPARYRPSLAVQRERLAALPEPALLRARLNEALRGLPFAPRVFEPFLRAVEAAKTRPLIGTNTLAGTALALKLDTLLVRTEEGYAALLPLAGVNDAPRLAQRLQALGDARVALLDLKQQTAGLLDDYRTEALRYALLGAGLIVVLLAVTLRSVSRVVRVLSPLVAGVLVTAALLNAVGEKLSLFHLVALLLVVGVGSNYALFFERPEADALERARTAAMLALCSATTILAFGLLAFSAAPVLHAIGLTVAIGAALCLVFSASMARTAVVS